MKIPIGTRKGKLTYINDENIDFSKIIANHQCGMSAIAKRQAYYFNKIMEKKR